MSDGVYIILDEIRTLKKDKADLEAKLQLIDDLMDEILMLQSPEAMIEVAMFIQEVIRQ